MARDLPGSGNLEGLFFAFAHKGVILDHEQEVTVAVFERVMEKVTETLYGDEQLRSNLTDDEAKIVLDWARQWIGAQVSAARDEASAKQIAQSELTRVRKTVRAINTFAKPPGVLRLADGVAGIESSLVGSVPLSREQVLALLVTLAGAAWQLRLAPPGKGK